MRYQILAGLVLQLLWTGVHSSNSGITKIYSNKNARLTKIPQAVLENRELEEIDMSSNYLTSLPTEVENWVKAIIIRFNDNKITLLTEGVRGWRETRLIYFNKNEIQELPIEVENWVEATMIIFENNKITLLTEGVRGWRKVEVISFNNNEIQELPIEVENWVESRMILFSDNLISLLTEGVRGWQKAETISFNNNEIQELPMEVENWVEATGIWFDHNKIKILREGVRGWRKVEVISFNNNEIQELPMEVENWVEATDIWFNHNKIKILTEGVRGWRKTRLIYIQNNEIQEVPIEVENWVEATKIWFDHNKINLLTEGVRGWRKAILISFSNNEIQEVPIEVENWIEATKIWFGHNKINLLTEGVRGWKKVREIYFDNNEIQELPTEVENWIEATKIWFDDNKIKLLTEGVRGWKNAERIHFHNNEIEELPTEVENWIEATAIWFDDNKIKLLTEGVRGWKKVERIHFHNNEIEELPTEVGLWRRAENIDLSNNKLRSLPHSVIYFKTNYNFNILKLTGNKLDELGEGDTLGWRELKSVFGTKVKLDESEVSMTADSKEDVYNRINSEPVHWNLDVLRTIKLDAAPKHILLGNEILNIWKDILHQYAPQDSRIEAYIKTLYGIDKHAFEGWRMYPESVDSTKDIIEAVFRKLDEIVKRRDVESVKLHLSVLEQALDEYPDRQIIALNSLYSTLRYNKDMQKSFESFTKHEIACRKNYIFEMTVMLRGRIENLSLLKHWKHKLRDEVGISAEHVTEREFDQDPFEGNKERVLSAFYTKLTARYATGSLVRSINRDPERLRQASDFFSRRVGGDIEMWNRAFEFGSDEDRNARKPKLIKKEGVEEILVEMGILKRYRPMLGY